MALFEHDIETGRRGLTGRGAQTLNTLLPTSLLGAGKFKSTASKDKDAFSGKVLKGMMGSGSNALFKTNEKVAKNTTNMSGFAKSDLRIQASTNQFTQRGFKLHKINITKAAKYYELDKKVRKDESLYYKVEKKNRKDDMRRRRKQDVAWERWRKDLLKASQDTAGATTGSRRYQRVRTAVSVIGGAGALTAGTVGVLMKGLNLVSGGTNRLGSRLQNNTQNLSVLNQGMKQLGSYIRSLSRGMSGEAVFGGPPGQMTQRQRRQEASSIRELRDRGFSGSQIREMRTESGQSARELARDRHLDNRNRAERWRDRTRIRNTFNSRGGVAGAFQGIGSVNRGIGRAAGGLGRAAGAIGSLGGKFLPGIGAAVEGARAIQAAKKGDFFTASVAAAGGIASIIPGLGPLVAIALESIAAMVPNGIKEAFNKWAGPVFKKMMGDMGSGKGMGGSIGKIMSKFGESMENVWRIIKSTILHPRMIAVYKSIGVVLLKYGAFLATGITSIFGFLADLFEGKKGLMVSFFDNLMPVMKSAYDLIVPGFVGLFSDLFKLVWATVKGAAVSFFTFGFAGKSGDPKAPPAASTTAKAVPGGVGGAGMKAGDAIGNFVKGLFNKEPASTTPHGQLNTLRGEKSKFTKLDAAYQQRDALAERVEKATGRSKKGLQRQLDRKNESITKLEDKIGTLSPEAMAAIRGGQNPMAAFTAALAVKKAAAPVPTSPTAPAKAVLSTKSLEAFNKMSQVTRGMESGGSGDIAAVNRGAYLKQPNFRGAFGRYQFAERDKRGGIGAIRTVSNYIQWLIEHPRDEYKMIGKTLSGIPIDSTPGSKFRNVWAAMAGGNLAGEFGTSQDIYAKKTYWDKVADDVFNDKRTKGFDINTLHPAVQSAIFSTSIGAGSGLAHEILSQYGASLGSEAPGDIIAKLVKGRKIRSKAKEHTNLDKSHDMWKAWLSSNEPPTAIAAGTKSGPGGGTMGTISTAVAGLYSTVMSKAGTAGGGVGGAGAIMGSIGNAIITKGAAALAAGKDAVQALGLPPNLMGGSAGAIARAVTGAVGAAVGETGRMSQAMKTVFAGDPNLQQLGQNIGQMTGHTQSMANAQNPEKTQIDPKDNGLVNLLGSLLKT